MSNTLDSYISTNYKFLKRITKGILMRVGSKLDSDSIITDAYLFIKCKHPNNDDEEQIQRLLIAFIRNEIERPRSRSNYKSKTFINTDDFTRFKAIASDNDTEEEKEYYNKKRAVEIYAEKEKDPIKKIVFNVFSEKGKRTCRDMGKHFGINYVSANKLINQLKKDIWNIYKDQCM